MKLTDLMPAEKWAALEKELLDRFNMSSTVYDNKGTSFTGTRNWCNELCPAIRENPEVISAICAPASQNLQAMARNTGQPVIEECDAAMVKIEVPVVLDGEFLGTVGGCGLLSPGEEVEDFMVEKASGMDPEKIAELAGKVGEISEETAREMARFIQEKIQAVILEYQNSGS